MFNDFLDKVQEIVDSLWFLHYEKSISSYEQYCLLYFTKYVLDHLSEKYPMITKGVASLLNDDVIHLEADDYLNQGRAEGIAIGEKGERKGLLKFFRI